MAGEFDLYGLIEQIYKMVVDFSNTFYNILNMKITIPNTVYQAVKFLEIPRSFTVLTVLGGSLLVAIVIASIIKAVNFLT